MEQLYNALLANVQIPQMAAAAQKSEPVQGEGFQKLLEQKKADAPADSAKPEKTEDVKKDPETAVKEPQEAEEPQKTSQPGPKSQKELEDQMVLAAIAARMQVPIVTETVEEVPQAELSLQDGLIPVAFDGGVEPELQAEQWTPAAGEQNLAELDGEMVQTLDAAVEAAPEAAAGEVEIPEMEAPETPEVFEAAPETKEPVVEVKVETGAPKESGEQEEEPDLLEAEVETPVFEDVKAVPVKVGEAPKAEAPPAPVEEQIAPKLTEALANGETRVELQLNPENLGKVTVEMTWSKDGNLVVQIHAENRETQNLLSKNTTGLEALLVRDTEQEVRVEVPRQEENQQQRQDLYEQQQQHKRQQQEERQERRQSRQGDSENFLQQLRLGLIPMDGE